MMTMYTVIRMQEEKATLQTAAQCDSSEGQTDCGAK